MYLAFKELMFSKKKFGLIIALIALITYLVYFLTSLAYGLASSYTNGINKVDANYIILSNESNDNIMMSMITDDLYESINVSNKAKLGLFPAVIMKSVDRNILSTKEDAYIFGVEDINFFLPNEKYVLGKNEVVIDESVKEKGYEIGDDITLSGSDISWRIVGFTSKATYQTAPIVYVSLESWKEYRFNDSNQKFFNGVLIKEASFEQSGNFAVYSISDFNKTLPGYTAQVLTFSMMIGFLILIIAFVLGIFIYVLTIQKISMFGVMKAQGISNKYISFSVLNQTILIVLMGTIIGLLLTIISGFFLKGKIPFAVNYLFYGVITLSFFIFPVISGLFSVSTITKIDPIKAIG